MFPWILVKDIIQGFEVIYQILLVFQLLNMGSKNRPIKFVLRIYDIDF